MKAQRPRCGSEGRGLLVLGMLVPLMVCGQVDTLQKAGKKNLEEADKFAAAVPVQQYLGALAPVAVSPFFGITMLSAAAHLEGWGVLPENKFLSNTAPLHNPLVLLSFAGLTALTSLPRFSKLSKPMALAVDQVENYAGILTVAVLQGVSQIPLPGTGGEEVVLQAGVLSFTATSLLMVVSAINLFVINAVKFFFEVLIWLSPIPLLDAAFEVGLKAFCAGMVALYAFSPSLATAVNLLLFVVCLAMFLWAYRMSNYFRVVLFGPILAGMLRALGWAKEASPVADGAPQAVREKWPQAKLRLPVYPGKGLAGFPKRVKAWLVQGGEGGPVLVRRKLFGGLQELDLEGARLRLKPGLIAHAVEGETAGGVAVKLQFSKTYHGCLEAIGDTLGAPLAGVAQEQGGSVRDLSQAMGRAARAGEAKAMS